MRLGSRRRPAQHREHTVPQQHNFRADREMLQSSVRRPRRTEAAMARNRGQDSFRSRCATFLRESARLKSEVSLRVHEFGLLHARQCQRAGARVRVFRTGAGDVWQRLAGMLAGRNL